MARTGGWCSACGRAAPIVAASLDPDHPLVECRWYNAEGEPRGHGRVPGVLDPTERAEVSAWHRARDQRRRHAQHLRDRLVRDCPDCQALRRQQGYALEPAP